MIFSRLMGRKPMDAKPLTPLERVSERAERARAPDRVVNTFADFGGPDMTIRASSPDDFQHLLEPQIKDLRHELGFDEEDFQRIVAPMLRRYVRWVHLLPASASHHHSRLGGLAVHGLHVATLAARAAHNSVFDFTPAYVNDTELRSHRRPRWQLGAATAGLLHDLGKILIDQIVTDASTGAVWNPFTEDLVSWAEERNVEWYALRFRPGDRLHRHESFSLFLTGQIAGPEVMGALSEFGRDILEAVTMSISGERDDAFGLRKLVHVADMDSSRQDREALATYWSEHTAIADPVLSRLIDAAASLVNSRRWRVNKQGNPLWVSEEGAYLIWPMAFNAMRQELVAKQSATGVPADPMEVAEMMVRAKLARPRVLSDGTKLNTWSIVLPESESPEGAGAALAGLLAKIGNAHSAIFIPEVSLLVSSTTVAEPVEIKIARDPTLPQVAVSPHAPAPAPGASTSDIAPETAQPSAQPQNASPAEAPSTDGPPHQDSAAQPHTEPEPDAEPEQHSAGDQGAPGGEAAVSPGSPAPAAATHALDGGGEVPPASASEGGVAPAEPGVDHEMAEAERVLAAAGPLGAALSKLAELLVTDPDRYKPKEKIRMVDGRTVVLRWPQAVRDVAGPELPALAKYLAENTNLLATSMKGQTFDYAQFGIAVALRISGTPWNVVGLNEALSDAFQVVSKRKRQPSNDELPA